MTYTLRSFLKTPKRKSHYLAMMSLVLLNISNAATPHLTGQKLLFYIFELKPLRLKRFEFTLNSYSASCQIPDGRRLASWPQCARLGDCRVRCTQKWWPPWRQHTVRFALRASVAAARNDIIRLISNIMLLSMVMSPAWCSLHRYHFLSICSLCLDSSAFT